MTLREITDAKRDAVLALSVAPDQVRFVGTVAAALEDANESPKGNPRFRAVYADDEPVGFVMLSWNVTPDPPRIVGPWFLWKLIIGSPHHRGGYGRETVRLVADFVRAEGASEQSTSYAEGDGGSWPFYQRVEFRQPEHATTTTRAFWPSASAE